MNKCLRNCAFGVKASLALLLVLLSTGAYASYRAPVQAECATQITRTYDPDEDEFVVTGIDCVNPCGTGCETAVPTILPGGGGASFTYCYCSDGMGSEPDCCTAILVFLPSWPNWETMKMRTMGTCHVTTCAPTSSTCNVKEVTAGGSQYAVCEPVVQ